MPESKAFKYDVFLNHSAKDRPMVRRLAERLGRDGLSVMFDEWETLSGEAIARRKESTLQASRTLVLCMSRNVLGADWAAMETATFPFRDPKDLERRFIPLRLDDAEIGDALKQFA